MLVSLNWIKDYVDLPAELNPRDLAERFTRTTAEIEQVNRIAVEARGLICAVVVDVQDIAGSRTARAVTLNVGNGKNVGTASAAPNLRTGDHVVYAPVGASTAATGRIGRTRVGDMDSEGLILPGEALGISQAVYEAVLLPADCVAGSPFEPTQFDDWIIDIDNKSITHRPDLWGHYGIAREIAAMQDLPLKPLPVVEERQLAGNDLPSIPIRITDANACRRYTGLMVSGVPTQPSPLWMQLRLGHVGMRPLSALVDLTNYIMADIGQPMHAFDGDKVTRIEVDWAVSGEVFRTLDGVDRSLPRQSLMIKSNGKSIAVAGIMGGLETEVSEGTSSLLLESASFDAPTIRRTASALGLRTEASARFEKSQDPANTTLAVQRFVHLAGEIFPALTLTSSLSDAYPSPASRVNVRVRPLHVSRIVGQTLDAQEIARVLTPLGFLVTQQDGALAVEVPSYRATGDVSIEADVIEEVARFLDYNRIEPQMPEVTARRFEPCAPHDLEQRTIRHFTTIDRFNEIHGYLWYDQEWIEQLGFDARGCIELLNPPAAGQERLRRTLMPGLLASLARNRYFFDQCRLLELGSVFEPGEPEDHEYRHVGLVLGRRQRKDSAAFVLEMKGTLERWAWQHFGQPVMFDRPSGQTLRPWHQSPHTAQIMLADQSIGRLGAVDEPLARRMDEHLASWSIAWAELRLTGADEFEKKVEQLGGIPPQPVVELDFSILVPAARHYRDVTSQLGGFSHPLLQSVSFVGSYGGRAIDRNQRSLTLRMVLGSDERTLVDEDLHAFRAEFEQFVTQQGYQLRR